MTPKQIGRRLEKTRLVVGLSGREFAKRAGIAQNTYNQYERGHNVPHLKNAVKLCEQYGLTLDWIYRGVIKGLPRKFRTLS